MRRFSVTVYGNTAAEMEEKAFSLARDYFGPQIGLAIDRSYGIFTNSSWSISENEEAKGTLYHASMDVHPQEALTGGEWYPGRTGGYDGPSQEAYDAKYLTLDFGGGLSWS
jgi:hypothetical protein